MGVSILMVAGELAPEGNVAVSAVVSPGYVLTQPTPVIAHVVVLQLVVPAGPPHVPVQTAKPATGLNKVKADKIFIANINVPI
jgi:hypothetical protein